MRSQFASIPAFFHLKSQNIFANNLNPQFQNLQSKIENLTMVGVAQLVEHRVVAPAAVGSNPITHPMRP
jgi:hypothetical protein